MSDDPVDNDPRHLAIMEEWVGRIVREVSDEIAAGIVKEVGRIFLNAKTHNFDILNSMEKRLTLIEAALDELKARKP